MNDRYPYRHTGPAVFGCKMTDYLISEANMIKDGLLPDPAEMERLGPDEEAAIFDDLESLYITDVGGRVMQSDWPHNDSYFNRCQCGTQFAGPKRAPSCWRCASEETRKWWNDQFPTDHTKEGE